jgi:hypothetical protein
MGSVGRIYTSSPQTTPGPAGGLTARTPGAIELVYAGGGEFIIVSSQGTFEAR